VPFQVIGSHSSIILLHRMTRGTCPSGIGIRYNITSFVLSSAVAFSTSAMRTATSACSMTATARYAECLGSSSLHLKRHQISALGECAADEVDCRPHPTSLVAAACCPFAGSHVLRIVSASWHESPACIDPQTCIGHQLCISRQPCTCINRHVVFFF
jgi:hypothetical protein